MCGIKITICARGSNTDAMTREVAANSGRCVAPTFDSGYKTLAKDTDFIAGGMNASATTTIVLENAANSVRFIALSFDTDLVAIAIDASTITTVEVAANSVNVNALTMDTGFTAKSMDANTMGSTSPKLTAPVTIIVTGRDAV